MTSEQWDQVERLFEEALARPAGERVAFLQESCDDPVVRQEVASLLETSDEAEALFDRLIPAIQEQWRQHDDALNAGAEDDPLELEGTRVRRYAVEEHLGGGGMGVVYRARDLELDRPVALKFLPPHLAAHPEAEERFVREAKAAAALGHSNIATIHEIGTTEDGRRFIAMAYYEGETLKEKIGREGPLPVAEAVGYAEQIAEALARAHEAGIVHRDVKPANVMVTETGEVKLLDFGLAKAAAETQLTEPGRRLGTAAYMSPEQAEGEAAGPPADLWALGVALYEMLAGERPFEGERETAVLHSILHDDPLPLEPHRSEVPSALEQIVECCLQKDPDKRYGSAEALLDDLRAVGADASFVPKQAQSQSESNRWGHRWLIGGAAVALLALGIAVGWMAWPTQPPSDETPGPVESSVAVLPFKVSGAGAQAWRDGMVTALSLGLDGVDSLRPVAARTVFATLEEQGLTKEALSTEEALKMAGAVGARYAIVGSALQLGENLRLSTEIRRTTGGERLGRAEVRGSPDRAMALANELTRKVLAILLERGEKQVPSVNLAGITTPSLEAFKDFLDGERRLRAGDFEGAAEAFEAAIQKDSTFALAYARRGLIGDWIGLLGFGDSPFWTQAHRRSDRLPRRTRRLVEGVYRSRNHPLAAADTLRRLTEAYPDDPRMWYSLGEVLWHALVPGGRPESERAFARAVELDPGNAMYYPHYVQGAFTVHHDSALAAQRIAALPKRQWREAYQTPMKIAFGDSAAQAAALARLDSMMQRATGGVLGLSMPLYRSPLYQEPLEDKLRREARESNRDATYLFHVRLLWGQVQTALRQMQELQGRVDPGPGQIGYVLARSMSVGIPVPDSILNDHLPPSRLGEDPSLLQLKGTALYLIEQGRMAELGPLLERIRTKTGPDAQVVQELKGYRAFRAGELERAASLWADVGESTFWVYGSIWRGDLYRRLGQLKRAEGWYQAAWRHPVAHERMGMLYQKMGKPEKAAAAYQRFIAAWEEADPALQSQVEKARKRIDALGEKMATE